MLVDSTGIAKYDVMATSPGPILVADFEGNAHKFPRQVLHWTEAEIDAGKFPEGLTDKSIVAAVVEDYKQFTALTMTLNAPKSPFKSFWIDSASIMTQRGEAEMVRTMKNTQQGFGDLLNFLRPVLTDLKTIAARSDLTLEVFGATAWCRDDRLAPAMQGGITSWFNNMMDLVGYMSISVEDKKLVNRMQIAPPETGDPRARGTKQMLIKYGGIITNPNITILNQENSSV